MLALLVLLLISVREDKGKIGRSSLFSNSCLDLDNINIARLFGVGSDSKG